MDTIKLFRISGFLIILALSAPSVYAETAVVGSILKQEGTKALPADDITEFDFTDIITTGIMSSGGDADTLGGELPLWYTSRENHTGLQIASTISDFNNASLTTTLSSGIDSHTPGDDESGKVTRNSGDITKFDIAEISVHIQGIDYAFAAVSSIDPEFAGGDSDKWLGYDSSGLVKQDSGFTDTQKRTIMPIARIQAKVGQSGPGSDISDVGITDVRYLISENDYRWHIYLENAIGALFETGGLITENSGTDRDLDLSAGILWESHRAKQTWNAFSNLSGLHTRHIGGVWSVAEKTLNMDNVNYDDGTDLTAMTNNNYHCSHTILMSPRGTQDAGIDRLRLFWIHCQSEWNSLQGAIDSGLDFGPFVDQATSGLVPLAQVIVKKNSANIISIIDARPRIGTAGGSITTASITRQGAYNNGSDIMLSTAQGGLVISDDATPVGDLFKLNNFANTTSFFTVSPSGVDLAVPLDIIAGGGTGIARVGGVLDVNTTQFSTPADTDEHDAITYSLPANTLNTNGKKLKIKAWGTVAANANGKKIRLYFGSTLLRLVTGNFNNLVWIIEAEVTRKAAGLQINVIEVATGNTNLTTTSGASTEDETGALIIKTTAENTVASAGDIVVEEMTVELLN